MQNHLKTETSPYLLQHAENPVQWYPWGEEALALAKQLDNPFCFLSAIRPVIGVTSWRMNRLKMPMWLRL